MNPHEWPFAHNSWEQGFLSREGYV
jgi:hypothetical protein